MKKEKQYIAAVSKTPAFTVDGETRYGDYALYLFQNIFRYWLRRAVLKTGFSIIPISFKETRTG